MVRRYEIEELDPSFLVGYNLCYSLIDCEAYSRQAVCIRTQLRTTSRLARINFSHPLDLEREITTFSMLLHCNREIGKVAWLLQCEVMYEDIPTPNSERNSMIMFMLHGMGRDLVQYICDTFGRTFAVWQMFMFKKIGRAHV